MARGKKKSNKFKSGLALDVEQVILSLSPTELAVECTFERNALDALNQQKKDNEQLSDLKKEVKKFDDEINTLPEIAKAKEELDRIKAENMSEEHLEAKENLSALSKGWKDDIKDRKKKLVYMEKTLRRHIESGALKRKDA